MPGIYDILMGEAPDAAQSAEALARAIRGQRAMGALGGMAGGGLPGLGKVNDAQALQDQGQMEKASEARMRYGQEAQNFKESQAAMKQHSDMVKAQMQAQYGLQAKQYHDDSVYQGRLAARDDEAKQQEKDRLEFSKFADKYNSGIASSRSPLGTGGAKLAQSARLLALKDSQKALDPQEVKEFSLGMAGLLQPGGGGNAVAQRLVEDLTPRSWKGDTASFLQYISARPQDAGAQEFVKRMVRTIAREQDVMMESVHGTMLQGAASRRDLLRKEHIRPMAEDYFRRAGMDDSKLAMIYGDGPMPTAGIPGRASLSPEDAQAKAWLEANPTHPSAGRVAAKLKEKGL